MSDGHRLLEIMREAGKQPQNEVVDIVRGTVTSVKPLKIKVEKRELTESFLIVGALCRETHAYTKDILKFNHVHEVPATSTKPAGPGPHSHGLDAQDTEKPKNEDFDLLLWRGLRMGDKVLMLKVGRGQKYFVMQREEGVTR